MGFRDRTRNSIHENKLKDKSLHIDWLDELRGFAVLFVLAYHCLFWPFKSTHLPWNESGNLRSFDVSTEFLLVSPVTLGWGGVAIFFVISGFCIHLSHLKEPTLGIFFWKRFWRICPPYFVTVFMFFGSDLLLHKIDFKTDGAFQLTTHLLMIHNFWNDSQFGINPSFWSIAVEAQLYLIYPILLLLQRLFGWKTTLVIALFFELTLKQGASILSLHGIVMPQTLTKGPFAYWCSWSIGAWMADKYKRRSELNWPRSLSPIACMTLVLATWIYKPISPLEFLAAALLSASVIAWKLTPVISGICTTSRRNNGIEDRILVNLRRHLAFIGIISYSLYLLHQPIISLMNKLLTLAPIYRELPTLLQYFTLLMVTLIVSLPSAYVFHILIERTSISWGKQLWRRLSYKDAA